MSKYNVHPLTRALIARRWSVTAGMNWLQDRGLISDNCVEVEDVAEVDVEKVLERIKKNECTVE